MTAHPNLNYIVPARYTHVHRISVDRYLKPQKNLMVIFFVIYISVISFFWLENRRKLKEIEGNRRKMLLVWEIYPRGTQMHSTGPAFPHIIYLHAVVTILHSLAPPRMTCWGCTQVNFCKKSKENWRKLKENRRKSKDFWTLFWK